MIYFLMIHGEIFEDKSINSACYSHSRIFLFCSIKSLTTASITGTETEFPNCLYAKESVGFTIKESGKPCSRAHSLGVILRGRLSCITPNLLESAEVKVIEMLSGSKT